MKYNQSILGAAIGFVHPFCNLVDTIKFTPFEIIICDEIHFENPDLTVGDYNEIKQIVYGV